MDISVLNKVVFYLWKKSGYTPITVMRHELKEQGVEVDFAELEEELGERKILSIRKNTRTSYSLAHWARVELQRMNPKDQTVLYEYLVRHEVGHTRLDLPAEKPQALPNKAEQNAIIARIISLWHIISKHPLWSSLIAGLLVWIISSLFTCNNT